MVISRVIDIFNGRIESGEKREANVEIGARSNERSQNNANTSDEPCLTCRLVGGFGVTSLGFSILYYTRKNTRGSNLPHARWQKLIGNVVGVMVTSLGVIRLLDLRIPLIHANDANNKTCNTIK